MHSIRFNVSHSVDGEVGNTISNVVAVEFRVCFEFDKVNAKFPLYHGISQRLDECKLVVMCHGAWAPDPFSRSLVGSGDIQEVASLPAYTKP